ncbi:MAG: rhodanese-like domain-containing protein [Burkholderiaceae bacterium]
MKASPPIARKRRAWRPGRPARILLCLVLAGGWAAGSARAQNSFAEAQRIRVQPDVGAMAPRQRPDGSEPRGGDTAGGPAPRSGERAPGNAATPGFGARSGQHGAPQADAITRMERQDFGVPAVAELHRGPMHAPTPTSIPGGQLITTRAVVALLHTRRSPVLVLDVLGGPERLPGAQYAVPAHQPGSFDDATQQQFGQYLRQATRGNREQALVLYCQSPHCWMSYNAALRAIRLGYTNVLWYRGGIEAWKRAGQPTEPAR